MEEDEKKQDNSRNAKKKCQNRIESGEDDADADNDEEGATIYEIDEPTLSRVIGNGTAFMCVIFITIGELMNEQNLWAVFVVGGILGTLNVIFTSMGLEKLQKGTSTRSLQLGDCIDVAAENNLVRFDDENPDQRIQNDECPLDGEEKRLENEKRKRLGTGHKKHQRIKPKHLPPGAIAIDIEENHPRLENDFIKSISTDRTYDVDGALRRSKDTYSHVVRRKRSNLKEGIGRPPYSPRVREKGISKRLRTNDSEDFKGVRKSKERIRRSRRDRDRSKKRKKQGGYSRDYNESRFIQV